MAWTAPRTWTTGEPVTSAILNTHIRDQFLFMAQDPPEVWLKRTSDVTISNDTLTTVSWQGTDRNVGEMWSSGATVTIGEEGVYAVTGNAQWGNGSSSGFSYLDITHNGTILSGQGNENFTNNFLVQKSVTLCHEFQVNDTITMQVRQNSGGDLDLQASQNAGTSLKVVQVQRRHV